MDKDALEDDIKERNFPRFVSKCQVIRTFESSKNTLGAILLLDSDMYDKVASNHFKIFIGHQFYYSSDDIISQCSKCRGFNDSSWKFIYDPAWARCAGQHIIKDCDYTGHIQCTNCSYTNATYNHNLIVNHMEDIN